HTRWPRDWSSDVCSSDLPAFGSFFAFGLTWLLLHGLGAGERRHGVSSLVPSGALRHPCPDCAPDPARFALEATPHTALNLRCTLPELEAWSHAHRRCGALSRGREEVSHAAPPGPPRAAAARRSRACGTRSRGALRPS